MSLIFLAPCQLHEEDGKALGAGSCSVAQDDFKLTILHFSLLSRRITGVCHHPWYLNLRFLQTQQSHTGGSHLPLGLLHTTMQN